jgi:hypothetical protein
MFSVPVMIVCITHGVKGRLELYAHFLAAVSQRKMLFTDMAYKHYFLPDV